MVGVVVGCDGEVKFCDSECFEVSDDCIVSMVLVSCVDQEIDGGIFCVDFDKAGVTLSDIYVMDLDYLCCCEVYEQQVCDYDVRKSCRFVIFSLHHMQLQFEFIFSCGL